MTTAGLPTLVRERLAELAPGHGPLLAAVSGGADSVALLRALAAAGLDVSVAHFDHGLRPDSANDAEFVRRLAERLGAPFHLGSAPVERVARERGWNLEDAARRLRYAFLHRTARHAGAELVVTGHTLDDQAETVLMQLLRGAAHLRGMPERRGHLVRPLLGVERAELLAYLRELGQEHRTDATNQDVSRTRAWLRHEVIPLLRHRYAALPRALGRLARVQADQEAYLAREAERLFDTAPGPALSQARLLSAPAALQREALRQLLAAAGAPHPAGRIEEIRAHLRDEHPYRLSLAPGQTLRLAYGRLEVVGETERPPERAVTGPADLPPGAPTAALAWPDLTVRGRRPGDRIRLPAGTRKLSDLLIDRKVPREERDALRVLASGSEVLWVEGIGPSAALQADPAGAAGEARDPDERFMRRALELAREAAAAGEAPIGAVVTCGGEIVAEARNETEANRDPTAHAEALALRRAAAARGDWRLAECTLFVTLEPCPMCFGAALQAHLGRVVYGASNRREGALGGVTDLREAAWKRQPEVRGGVLAREAGELLRGFFAARRGTG